MVLSISKVSKTYGNGFSALSDISISIEKGELIALLGLSGSGKTTLLRIIAGLEIPTTGTLTLDGEDFTNTAVKDRNFGFVFQNYALFEHMSVFQNIAFGLTVQSPKPKKSEIKKSVDDLLEMMDINHLSDRFPLQLSGGQQQRVAMARALAINPKLLLLDEPFSALDAQIRGQLRTSTKALQKRLNIATILVTHDQEEAFTMADKIAVMHNGIIEQFGTANEIINTPKTDFVKNFIIRKEHEFAGSGI